MIERADVVIIGGGSTGTSIAFHLSKMGLKNMVLLEKNFIASGPTGRSSAIIRTHYSNPTTAGMALYSLKFFQNFEVETGGPAGFKQIGFLVGVGSSDVKSLEANVGMQREIGIKTMILSVKDLKELEPRLYTEDLVAAAYEPESGYADPALTANSFANAARSNGVRIYQQTEATGIVTGGGRVKSVITSRGEIATSKVVNATGVWANQVAEKVSVRIPIRPTRHPVCLLQRPRDFGGDHPIYADFIHQTYMKPEASGISIIGTIDPEVDLKEADPDNFNENVDMDTCVDLSVKAARRFPAFYQGSIKDSFASLYDITPDQHPILDEVTTSGIEGFYCAVGLSGHGFKLSPIIGKMMAELVIDGKARDFDIKLFRFTRFKEGKLIKTRYSYATVA